MGVSSAQGNPVGFLPAGCVMPYAGAAAPAGWLLCAGQAVSRTEYGALFAVVGTTYGTGNGTTTFNLPDLRGRTVAGVDNMGGSAAGRLTNTVLTASNQIGATGGAQTHTLTSGQSGVPAHQHSNTLSSNTVASSGHRHDFRFALNDNYYAATGTNGAMTSSGAYRYSTGAYQGSFLDGTLSDTRRDATGASAGTSARFGSIGDTNTPSATTTVGISNANNTAANAAEAHTNTQPTMVMNYIIKAVAY